MRTRRLRQSILVIAQIITLLVCLGALAPAQAPSPTPTPAPVTPPGSAWADMISALIGHAGALIPLLQTELEGPLLPWLERLSWGLAAVVFTFTFARMWRESSGAGADLFWWFGRAVICLALMGSGPAIISRLDTIGQAVAWGGNDGRSSVLYKFYDSQRKSFEVGYARFAKGTSPSNRRARISNRQRAGERRFWGCSVTWSLRRKALRTSSSPSRTTCRFSSPC